MSQESPAADCAGTDFDGSNVVRGEAALFQPEGSDLASERALRDAAAAEKPDVAAFGPHGSEPAMRSAPAASGRSEEIAAAVDVLAQIALQLDDPVSALDEGAEALAEALAMRDEAIQRQHHAAAAAQAQQEMQRAEFADAYRHARLHRVGELVDLGYELDQAVAITNANETDIRIRALAAGRDPAGVIYRYAQLHGYQPRNMQGQGRAPAARPAGTATKEQPAGRSGHRRLDLEALAAMSDDAFSRATSGDRWQRLLQGN